MSQQWYDPGSKWLIAEHGAALLHVAGARDITACVAKQPEVVQPRKLPDGLLGVRFGRSREEKLVLAEIATYPEERVVTQISDGMRLVRQVTGGLPDAVVFCLAPKGNYRVPQRLEATSQLGWAGEVLWWKVVELWTLQAEELLTASGVGAVPWATLAKYDGAPEVLLRRCRDRIEREGGEQRSNLLAVTQVFARMHYDQPDLLAILGGRKAMIQAPIIQELLMERDWTRSVAMITSFLVDKFGEVNPDISAGLAEVKDIEKLDRLLLQAGRCASLDAFAARLREELPQPRPASTRGKKRKKAD